MKQLDLSKLSVICTDDRLIKDFEKAYSAYHRFFKPITEPYTWVFDSDVSLGDKLRTTASVSEFNAVQWLDIYNSVSAAENMFYRRSHTLVLSSFQSLVESDFLSATILARSLLEVCMWNVYHSVVFEKTVSSIKNSPNKNVLASPELQDLILKLIWGTNEKNVVDEIKQHKIYKIFDKVAKSAKRSPTNPVEIEKLYDALCEYVHPNVEGNNLFIDYDINAQRKPISEVRLEISYEQNADKKNDPILLVMEVIIWCFSASVFTSQKYGNTRQSIIRKFNLKKKRKKPTLH